MKSVEKIVLVFFFWFSILAMIAVAQDVKSSETIARKSKPKTTLAQRKADIQASRRRLGHVGGGFGGGRAEGVGKGRTRDSAIRHCCYWGKRKPIQIGVAKSANGWWYACVLYR